MVASANLRDFKTLKILKMKKILIFLFLTSSFFAFSQVDVKTDLLALSTKKWNIAIEKRIKRFGFEIAGEYSFPKPISVNQVDVTYKPRLGGSASVRYYLLNFKLISPYVGAIYKCNIQKFSTRNNQFIRKEQFPGLLIGLKAKLYKHFYIDFYTAITYKPYRKFIDINRNYQISKTTPRSILDLEDEDIPFSGFLDCPECYPAPLVGGLINLSINYKF
jgi:hypothetical protein